MKSEVKNVVKNRTKNGATSLDIRLQPGAERYLEKENLIIVNDSDRSMAVLKIITPKVGG